MQNLQTSPTPSKLRVKSAKNCKILSTRYEKATENAKSVRVRKIIAMDIEKDENGY